ncbi:unnamed protein product, partial [Laminaria digitata]
MNRFERYVPGGLRCRAMCGSVRGSSGGAPPTPLQGVESDRVRFFVCRVLKTFLAVRCVAPSSLRVQRGRAGRDAGRKEVGSVKCAAINNPHWCWLLLSSLLLLRLLLLFLSRVRWRGRVRNRGGSESFAQRYESSPLCERLVLRKKTPPTPLPLLPPRAWARATKPVQ